MDLWEAQRGRKGGEKTSAVVLIMLERAAMFERALELVNVHVSPLMLFCSLEQTAYNKLLRLWGCLLSLKFKEEEE